MTTDVLGDDGGGHGAAGSGQVRVDSIRTANAWTRLTTPYRESAYLTIYDA